MIYHLMAFFMLLSTITFGQTITQQCTSDETYLVQYGNSNEYRSRNYAMELQSQVDVTIAFSKNYHFTDATCDIESVKFVKITKKALNENIPALEFIVDVGKIFDVYTEKGIRYYVYWKQQGATFTILGWSQELNSLVSLRTILTGTNAGYECLCEVK